MTDDLPAQRIAILEEQAGEAVRAGEPERAREYVRLARRIAERNRRQLPRTFRHFTCDACDAYLVVGRNARVRTRDGHVVVTCDCGEQSRHGYQE